jgi:hypothetical protein
MPPHLARGNASRARVRVAVEHVVAAQKCRLGLVIRAVGLARATAPLAISVTHWSEVGGKSPSRRPFLCGARGGLRAAFATLDGGGGEL